MSIFHRAIVTIGLLGLLSGCATTIMEGYIGKTVAEVVNDYGMPASGYDVDTNKRAFVWQMQNSVVVPGNAFSTGTVIGNQVFANTYTSSGYVSSSNCSYVLIAERTRMDIEGPAAWTVVSYNKPRLDCY